MKYIIMADGESKRWLKEAGYKKQYIKIYGETLICRSVRLLLKYDPMAKIIITTHEENLNIEGATIYQPLKNELEIDRFTIELLEKDVCYLYGDTFYSEDAIKRIVMENTNEILFFGNQKSIIAVKIKDSNLFYKHFLYVRNMLIKGEINEAIGWEIYHSILGMPLETRDIFHAFIRIVDMTQDFNSLKEYNEFLIKIKDKEVSING